MARYKKFIILENWRTNKLDIRFGYPIYHADLIENSDNKEGWKCIGGRFWDMNFETKEIVLFGKGDKHRISYLNAKAEVSLKDYLNERTDNNPALFVYDRKPYSRFKKSGIELMVRKIMERTSDVSTHVTPHVFRHTTASVALDRGMNIVDVSKLLGHAKVETTMEYITTDSTSIKNNHRNCVI